MHAIKGSRDISVALLPMIPEPDQSTTLRCFQSPPTQSTWTASTQGTPVAYSLPILDHDVWNLNILLCLIFCSDLEDDVLLVTWDGLFADCLKQFAHAKKMSAILICQKKGVTYGKGYLSCNFFGG